ncbi:MULTISPECIES: dicarboxylate/amino acid:cation symporter [Anaerococcus]|uniref:Dicarboxylate/amino acid:cation symporter n=1 Tax=Anaerococcus nagyae TaxID=1755241 RepID=A0A3E2TLC1_9FIRM|nr:MULTISPECIES: dicarboxylate/amino acid:cation symporter [Anaerococcus]MBP2069219.1 Na+/H+-dicarboxylate symporter [Anaerococcus nagyae]MDU2353173.1 dicarboxylate/amino acid:cation symporter [Anaerococcus sp.]RGB78169.1 dicarboxylate/amino acid:cation symporter [Anaerococcus nagyae]
METQTKEKSNLAKSIFIALILAIILGLLLQNYSQALNSYVRPLGDIFLNLLKFIVTPIVLFSIMGGIISMKDIKKVGEVGGFTVVYYFCTTAFAIIIGLGFANIFKKYFPVIATASLEYSVDSNVSFMDTIVNIFPSNFLAPIVETNMLQVIVSSVLIGFAILLIDEKKQAKAIETIDILNDIFMKVMELILKLSPFGVFCLLMPVIAENGPKIIGSLASVLLVAYLAYIVHALVVYSFTIKTLGGLSPKEFFKGMMPAMMFAFSSASSMGTIPLNLQCCEELGADRDVTSFVLPLGATINMDGTAIYQGVCAVFIASCYGINLSLGQMLTIVLTATLASIGTAGVPGSGMIMLAMVLQAVGLPVEGIALVAGIDRIFDMGRTTLNITGDATAAIINSNRLRKKGKIA